MKRNPAARRAVSRRIHVLEAGPRPGLRRRSRSRGRPAPVLADRGSARLPGGRRPGPLRRLRGPRPSRPRLAPAPRSRGAEPLVRGPGREGRALRGQRERRQGLQDRGRQGFALLRRARARGARHRRGPGRTRLRGHRTRRQGLRDRCERPIQHLLRSRRQVRLGPPLRQGGEPLRGHGRGGQGVPGGRQGQGADRAHHRGDAHPLPRRGRQGQPLRGQRGRGRRLPGRPHAQGLRRARLAVPRGEGSPRDRGR